MDVDGHRCRHEARSVLVDRHGDLGSAYDFMHDLAARLTHRVQLTTDGHKAYLEAVESAFNLDVDYAVLQKIYGAGRLARRATAPLCASAARWRR